MRKTYHSACHVKTLGRLFGTVSVLALGGAAEAAAPAIVAPPEPTEEILVTGSLIRGAQAVGVPVTSLGEQDFQESGAVTVADLLRTVPSISVTQAGNSLQSGTGNLARVQSVDIHNLNGGSRVTRTLMLIDGKRFPMGNVFAQFYDPSIIPQLAVQRVDVLADGASATYGSDAIAGVVNVILRRGYDGAMTQLRLDKTSGADIGYNLSQLFGRRWDTGDVTVSFETYLQPELKAIERDFYTFDFTPWGLDNRTPVRSAIPGIISVGAPTPATGTTCTNCYSLPSGNGVGLTWAQVSANPGTRNLVNPYQYHAGATPTIARNAATITFDQEIMDGIQFVADAFYSNRRDKLYSGAGFNQGTNSHFTLTIPTNNPYYPTGAPAGLRISYSLIHEIPQVTVSIQVSGRYSAGLNFELPYDWRLETFYAMNEEHDVANMLHYLNANNISAALGNTIASASGVNAYSKPANVPYLNAFCDPTAYTCNSPATLNYVDASTRDDLWWHQQQVGANFSGPLMDLPGGVARAAVGASFVRDKVLYVQFGSNTTISNQAPYNLSNSLGREVSSLFGQLNVPLVGEANMLPMIRRLDLELSMRFDHYSDVGNTTNPKFAVDWEPVEGLTLHGSWGKSFRAPSWTEMGELPGRSLMAININGGGATNSVSVCQTVGATPLPGSAAAVLNPTCSAALQFQGGIALIGPAGGLAGLSRPAGSFITPEKSTAFSIGADFTPNILPGLNLSSTYYRVKITNAIATVGGVLSDPKTRFALVIAGDPGFITLRDSLLSNPLLQATPGVNPASVTFITDGAPRNIGEKVQSGIDFNTLYNWDMGNLGAWRVGVSGTYTTVAYSTGLPGSPRNDSYNAVAGINSNVATQPRMRYRAQFGWSDFGFNVVAFVNYNGHYFHSNGSPPAALLVNFPDYSNLVPAQYTGDLAIAYNTGDEPENDYLKNINLQFVVNNVLDRNPPFVYRIGANGGNSAYDGGNASPLGRTLSLTITKTW